MQSYNNITDCIKMCERMLRNNNVGYSKFDLKSKFEQNEFFKMHDKRDFHSHSHPRPIPNETSPFTSNSTVHGQETPFHPSRTIAVQNFLPEAETHVQSLVAMFGIMESCEIIKDDAPSCLAVVQYRSKTSAADALLAMPCCQVRGSNLVVHLLWNGPYEHIGAIADSVHHSFKECAEKRVVCVGHLPRNINPEVVFRKCSRYGTIEDVKLQSQEQGAFAYVVYRTALSAAVATYCLRNSSTSSAALMLGYRYLDFGQVYDVSLTCHLPGEILWGVRDFAGRDILMGTIPPGVQFNFMASDVGSPVLLGPVRVRPLDQYPVPLSAFDVRCICTRFLDYSRFKGLFVNMQRKLPLNYVFRPGTPDYCIRIPTSQVKGVSLFIEVVLFPRKFLKNTDDLSETAYNTATSCNHLFRFSVDFGLHKPIMSHDDRIPRQNSQYLRWNSFFILDLQVCYPWNFADHSELRLVPRLQGMNHIYSEIDPKAFDDDGEASCWFGGALRHTTCNLSTSATDDQQHREKIKFIISENLPFVRLVGKAEELNAYQIPVHVFSDIQSSMKH